MYIYINKLDLNLSVCLCLYLCLCHPLSVYFSGRAPSGDCVLYALRSRHHTCCLLRGVGEDRSFPTRMSRAQRGTARQHMFLNAVQRQIGFAKNDAVIQLIHHAGLALVTPLLRISVPSSTASLGIVADDKRSGMHTRCSFRDHPPC